MASGDTKTEALLNVLGNGGDASQYKGCCNTKSQSYILDAIDRIQNVEDEVEELKNNPDVVDIVDTYADLQAYDTQHLTENDIIRVLQDETHSGNSTYYRFTKNPDTWTFIGEISGGGGGDSYNVYSTVTTSNSNRGGAIYLGNLNASQEQFADPTTSDTHARYIHMLPYSNTIKPANNSIILGSELTSSNASTGIGLGFSASVEASGVINIGGQYGRGENSVIIGRSASNARGGSNTVLIGYSSQTLEGTPDGAVGLGAFSKPSRTGEVNIGSSNTSFGFNNTNYRLISGVHDGQDAHDAATKGQLDAARGSMRELTTADYNFNYQTGDKTEPYNCVALWLLDPGLYYADMTDSNTAPRIYADMNDQINANTTAAFLVTTGSQVDSKTIVHFGSPGETGLPNIQLFGDIYSSGYGSGAMGTFLTAADTEYLSPTVNIYNTNWPENAPDGIGIFMFQGTYKVPRPVKLYLNETDYIDNFVGTFSVFGYENYNQDNVVGFTATNTNVAGGEQYIGETIANYPNYTKGYISKVNTTAQ